MSHLFNHNGAENTGYSQPVPLQTAAKPTIPGGLVRKQSARWPRLSEPEMVRHYTWLSKRNFGIDTGFYPLGSCTMKHNPRVNEVIAQLPASLTSTPTNLSIICRVCFQYSTKCNTCSKSVRAWTR